MDCFYIGPDIHRQWVVHHSGFGEIPKGGLALGLILGIRALINEHTGRWY